MWTDRLKIAVVQTLRSVHRGGKRHVDEMWTCGRIMPRVVPSAVSIY